MNAVANHAGVYGLDIGGTKIEVAVYDADMNEVQSWRLPTPTQDYAQFLDTIEAQVRKADALSGAECALGIAMPGITAADGRQISSNVPCAQQQTVCADLAARLQRTIAIENDCRCFALSEATLGAGKDARVVFGAILGTGAAGGLCVEGTLFRSDRNLAGEYGHLPVSAAVHLRHGLPLLDCGCGLRGCAEPYISGSGLTRIYRYFLAHTPEALQTVDEFVTTFDWHRNFRAGQEAAKQAYACYMDYLGASFASLVLNYDPDVVVVGGGLSQIDEILDALPDAMRAHLFAGASVPPVRRAVFGDASGKRGAALLGRQHARV